MGSAKVPSKYALKRNGEYWESVYGSPILCTVTADEYLPESWRVDGKEIQMRVTPVGDDRPSGRPEYGGRLIILNSDTILLSVTGARKFEQQVTQADWMEVTVIRAFMDMLKRIGERSPIIQIAFEEVVSKKKERLVDFKFTGTIRVEPGDYSDVSIATDIEESMNYAATRLGLKHPLIQYASAKSVRVQYSEVIERGEE